MLEWRKLIITLLIIICTGSTYACLTAELLASRNTGDEWPPVITAERPIMDFTYSTNHFLIHFNTTGDSAVFHPDEDLIPPGGDNVPDYVNRVAEYFETAHYVYIELLNYDEPPPDDVNLNESKYDVYITTINGLTSPEFISNHPDYIGRDAWSSFIQVGNDMFTENHPNDPYPYLKSVCAHEYFHAVQMAYRTRHGDEKPWFYELTAMWAEERVYDELNELYFNLEDYYSDIDNSIYLHGGLHMYGAWVFAEYLSQNYGNDIIKRTFERLIINPSSIQCIQNTLLEDNLDFNEEFTLYSIWNYFTGTNYHYGFFEESMYFPTTVPVLSSHAHYPVDWEEKQDAVENLGISYIYFDNPGINKGSLIVDFKSDFLHPEGVCLAGIYQDHRSPSIQMFKVQAGDSIRIVLENFNECDGAVMAVNWSYQDTSLYGTADYYYKAEIDTFTTSITTGTEAALPESFTLNGNYPNPFNLSTEITFYWNFNPSYYTIAFYDITGRQVGALTGSAVTGENRVNWSANENLASGVYYYRIEVDQQSDVGRMLLLK